MAENASHAREKDTNASAAAGAAPRRPSPAERRVVYAALGALVVLGVLATYHAVIPELVRRWYRTDYLYCFLVPFFAGYLLWHRREMLRGVELHFNAWGLGLLLAAGAMRWLVAFVHLPLLFDAFTLVPFLAGAVLFVGGRDVFRWSWPAVVILIFAVPLPDLVGGMLSGHLQRIGTHLSTFALQTLGVPAVSQGNVILLTEHQLGVVEACSGIRMLMLFVTICTGAALLMKRPLLDRFVVLLSAAPIAVIANVIRITATGLLYEHVSAEWAEWLYHDAAGFFMMPLAISLVLAELAIFSVLIVEEAPRGQLVGTIVGDELHHSR